MRLEDEIHQPHFSSEFQKLAVNILYTHGWLVSHLNTVLKRHKLTTAQFNILRILRGQYPETATISLLQERMLDKMSDTSRLVERLRGKGLVERDADSVDRRRVAVRITDEGLQLLERIGDLESVMAPLFASCTEKQMKALNDGLDSLRG